MTTSENPPQDPVPNSRQRLDNASKYSQPYLEEIKERIGEYDISFFDPSTSNGLQLWVGHTDRVLTHYAYSTPEWQTFLETCEQLPNNIGQEITLNTVQTLLELVVPQFCHIYLYMSACDAHTELLIVLDRPTLTKNSLFTLLPPPGEHSPAPVIVDNPTTSEEGAGSEAAGPAIEENLEECEAEISPSRVALDHIPPPFRGCCATLMAELQRFGSTFWIYHYMPVQQFRSDGTPFIDHVFEPLVSMGQLSPKYLRCLVWFGLGAENSRNTLSLSVGEFLVIRSEEEPSLVAMVQLDWEYLANLAAGMNA